MLLKICNFLSKHLPSTTISKDGVDYLTRYYLLFKDYKFGNIYLHHFHNSDLDLAEDNSYLLHNHPFPWAFGMPLVNGYTEERRNADNSVTKKFVKPFSINFISHKEFHRVELSHGKAWTLFVTGPRTNGLTWGFWNRNTKEYIDWKKIPGAIE